MEGGGRGWWIFIVPLVTSHLVPPQEGRSCLQHQLRCPEHTDWNRLMRSLHGLNSLIIYINNSFIATFSASRASFSLHEYITMRVSAFPSSLLPAEGVFSHAEGNNGFEKTITFLNYSCGFSWTLRGGDVAGQFLIWTKSYLLFIEKKASTWD